MATVDVDASTGLIFVLGTGRCGSTVVEEVLCRHPAVGFVSNLEDRFSLPPAAGRWNGTLYRRLPARASQKGRLRFAPSEAYHALDRDVSPLLSTSFRDLLPGDVTPWLEKRARAFFLERARVQGVETFLHKFTGWPRAGFLARVFPTARFIHVVRDGRAVANSWLQMPWWLGYSGPDHWQWGALPAELTAEWDASGRSFVMLAGLLWRALIEAHDEARASLPSDRWLEVRYEDIAARPRQSFAALLEFCGLDWDEGFERGFARHAFDRSRTHAFRRDLEPADVAVLTRGLEQSLAAHGYEISD
jgi:Sulfotransferase family